MAVTRTYFAELPDDFPGLGIAGAVERLPK